MNAADLALCVERHATSKIPDGDLAAIRTLGFRGEALPSIASVSRLEIRYAARGAAEGFRAHGVEDGVKGESRRASHPQGTRIEARDLFAATPARLKFLKTDRAEAQACADTVRRLALAPSRRALFRSQAKSAPASTGPPAARTAAAGAAAAGARARSSATTRCALDATREGVRLTGFVGVPTFNKRERAEPVRVRQRPGGARQADRRRAARRLSRLSPARAPRRRGAVPRLRSRARSTSTCIPPRPRCGSATPRWCAGSSSARSSRRWRPRCTRPRRPAAAGARRAARARLDTATAQAARLGLARLAGRARLRRAGASRASRLSRRAVRGARRPSPLPRKSTAPLGAARAQLHGNYIVAQTRDGVVIVDQHAAHERIVYERLKRQRDETGIERQILLSPLVVDLDPAAAAALVERAEALRRLGLVVEGVWTRRGAVRETPTLLAGADLAALLRDLADDSARRGRRARRWSAGSTIAWRPSPAIIRCARAGR